MLVALNASVKIRAAANGSRPKDVVMDVEDFIQKGARKSLAVGIICEIEVPACEAAVKCVYNRVAKVETDISILSSAAKITVSGKSIRSVSLVVGNGARPIRLRAAEEKIRGRTPAEAAEIAARSAGDIPAESDIRASADYRREVAGVLVKRLFQSL